MGTLIQRRARRGWPRARLSLRVLMAIVLLLGCGLGWIVHRARVQRDAVAAISSEGGSVEYDWQFTNGRFAPNGRPRWLRERLGPDYFDLAVKVYSDRATDAEMVHVGRPDGLEDLNVGGRVTDAGLAHLRGLHNLRFLAVGPPPAPSPGVTAAGLASLRGLTRLRGLTLHNVPLADAGLSFLGSASSLERLSIPQSQITDAGVVHRKGLGSLTELSIGPGTVTDPGLAGLGSLTKLARLDSLGSRIDDLAPIRNLTGMQILTVADAPLRTTDSLPSPDSAGCSPCTCTASGSRIAAWTP